LALRGASPTLQGVAKKPIRVKVPGMDYEVRVHGARAALWTDLYHATLRQPWPLTIATIAGAFLAINAVYALAYWSAGGIANAAHGSFADAFFFSVQTMGTIGYGAMYPVSRFANWLVVSESIVGLTLTALATGLVFAKFSRPTARVVFSRQAVVSPMNGVPTLMFRIGNERSNPIVDARIRMSLVRTELTEEGKVFYRMHDLRLTRERALSLSRSWSVLHAIDAASPLYGASPESLVRDEVELQIMVVGLDDTSMQPVHAKHQYAAGHIAWGARLVDVLSEADDGALVLDLHKFHDVEPTQPTPDFPYSLHAVRESN
jgi:inward rectifier potassium channel